MSAVAFCRRGDLRRHYESVLTGGRPVVVACGSGTTACHNALAMRLAGLPDPILYAGSFSDWSRSGMPIVTGPEPGDAAALSRGRRMTGQPDARQPVIRGERVYLRAERALGHPHVRALVQRRRDYELPDTCARP